MPTAIGFIVFIGILSYLVTTIFIPKDSQCLTSHTPSAKPPVTLKTVENFFQLANYEYEKGDCMQAITDYTKAITINHNIAEIYNNRAYTYMRMQDYKDALFDLDTALMLNPHYITALMNRGDIYNYYYAIDKQKAVDNYNTVMSLVPNAKDRQKLNLCGHRLLALNKGWNLNIIWQVLTKGFNAGCN